MEEPKVLDAFFNTKAEVFKKTKFETLKEAYMDTLGNRAGAVHEVTGKTLTAEFSAWKKRNADGKRGALAGGGDGTYLTLVRETLHTDIVTGPLPFGGACLDTRVAGFSPDPFKAIEQYKDAVTREIDVGTVNHQPFLIGVGFGGPLTDFYKIWEKSRDEHSLVTAAKYAAFAVKFPFYPRMEMNVTDSGMDSRRGSKVFLVSNNVFDPRKVPDGTIDLGNKRSLINAFTYAAHRENLDGGKLGLYMWDGNPGLLGGVMEGRWTRDTSITRIEGVSDLSIAPVSPREAKEYRDVVLDGDVVKMEKSMTFSSMPKAARVFAAR
jgi:diacylglycerol kinase family enzyme